MAISLVMSKLDYCNSLLVGLPQSQMKRLQAVQNTAARVVSTSKKSAHITPILRELHWLPVSERIQHKLLSVTHRAVHGSGPQYLSELVSVYVSSRSLRSSSKTLLRIPHLRLTKTKRYGQRAFRFTAPSLWNPLPESLRACESTDSFRSHLKTKLFL